MVMACLEGAGERIGGYIATRAGKVFKGSACVVIAIAGALMIALLAAPELFVLDATEEGFKVASAPESVSWDLLSELWTGAYSDPMPPPPEPAASWRGNFNSARIARLRNRWAGMSTAEREAFRAKFGGRGGGGGRGRGDQSMRGRNRQRAAGGALVALRRDAFRPRFVDVYALQEKISDPTYYGTGALAYGCCGILAKEQRTWPETLDMLSADNLLLLRSFETTLRSDLSFKRYCYQQLERDENDTEVGRVDAEADPGAVSCARPVSITNFFWPSVAEGPAELVDCSELHEAGSYCELLDENDVFLATGADVNNETEALAVTARIFTPDGNGTSMRPVAVVKDYLADLQVKGLLDPTYRLLLDHRFTEGRTNSRGVITKVVFEEPNNNEEVDEERWLADHDAWLNAVFLPLLEGKADESALDFLAYTASFLETWREEAVLHSVAWSMGALGMVFFLLWARMRGAMARAARAGPAMRFAMSFVLPIGALAHVLLSFPVSWAIYRFIYQQRYVGYMNFLSIFIALGIGVDDVFIMYDAWLQSADEGFNADDFEGRMRWAWSRAARAMLITSVTDGLAFLANSFSVIAAVRVFGYLMATIVLVNYVLDVTVFPALLVLVAKWVERRKEANPVDLTNAPAAGVIGKPGVDRGDDEKRGFARVLRPRTNRIERFLQDVGSSLLYRGRFGVLALWLLATVGFAAGLSQLKSSDRAFRFETFPDWFPMVRVYNLGLAEAPGDVFGDPTPVQPIYVVLGIEGLEGSDAETNNPLDRGTPVLQASFDLTPATQEATLALCESLQSLQSTRDGQVLCPMRHFREWLAHPDVANVSGVTWPVDNATRLTELLSFFTHVPQRRWRCMGNLRGVGAYELNGDRGKACRAFHNTSSEDRAGLKYVALEKEEYPEYFGYDEPNDRVSWLIAAVVNSTLSAQGAAAQGRPVYDELQAAVDAAAASMGVSIFQAAALWPKMVTEEAMVSAAWQGALASLGVAAVTLLCFTHEPRLTLLSVAAIASVVTCTMGIMPVLGWRFGFMEAMCTVFVVGFSVDFVAHCAVRFLESKEEDPRVRAAEAIGSMGASLFWGMLSTVGAAFFLIFCVMVPFSKMGIFLMWNQALSFVVAIVFFSTALMVVGPRATKSSTILSSPVVTA